MRRFPNFRQHDEMDCGPACLQIIAAHYGKHFPLGYFRGLTETTRQGTTMLALSLAAEKIGFRTMGAQLSYDDLKDIQPFPCIAYWNQRHYVVIYRIKNNRVYLSDPAHGLLRYTKEEFLKAWAVDNQSGIILNLEPTPAFEELQTESGHNEKGFFTLLHYLFRYKRELWQVILGLFITSFFQFLFPFLTQCIVDTGIRQQDLSFVFMILIAQLLIFLGKTTVELLRSYMMLHVSTRINVNLLTDFFIKLMRLPLGYFDSRMVGDILQRINDHRRVESFLTSSTVNTLFSFLNILVFGIILSVYDLRILLIFCTGSAFYVAWIMLFMKRRAALDYKLFSELSANQEKNYEMVVGMQEIKLQNAERRKRWQWGAQQARLFRINIKSLTLKQAQSGGAMVLNELKNIVISYFAARLVIQGDITLGKMLAVSYIIGQLNAPILQIIEFLQSFQDARLSMARINEIHNRPEEEPPGKQALGDVPQGDIQLCNLSFSYQRGAGTANVLKDLTLTIPHRKVTAIVGASGSGKTTLLKLLLKFYEPTGGNLTVGGVDLLSVSPESWRKRCGVVMQDGFVFNDTVAGNICVADERVDWPRMIDVAKLANLHDFVESLPLGYHTKIGANGMGMSAGQRQRLLIARALYQDPDILLFDEATSALDARNEKEITEKLNRIFNQKTVIIIAHRLSTVRHADRIILLEQGRVVETGRHEELVRVRGPYFNLVSNQLELAN